MSTWFLLLMSQFTELNEFLTISFFLAENGAVNTEKLTVVRAPHDRRRFNQRVSANFK
jgi:hypothetical protein